MMKKEYRESWAGRSRSLFRPRVMVLIAIVALVLGVAYLIAPRHKGEGGSTVHIPLPLPPPFGESAKPPAR